MDRFATKIAVGLLVAIAVSQACAGCSPSEPVAIIDEPEQLSVAYPSHSISTPVAIVVPMPKADLDLPDKCDRLYAGAHADGRPKLTKRLPSWLRNRAERDAHQEQVRWEIGIIVDEMGGDRLAAEFLFRKSIFEASGNEESVHIRNPDLEANRSSARRGRMMSTERWREARVSVYDKDGKVVGTLSAWGIGRGAYAMNTGLYMHHWSTDAPPWSLCDLTVATVTAIWSIRDGLQRCNADDLRSAYRLISSGKCGERSEEKEMNFDRLARGRVRGLRLEPFDADAKADFGDRWPSETSDPAVVLAVIRARLQAEAR